MSSIFSDVPLGPPIAIFALNQRFLDDKHPSKVNLGVGAYRTEEGKPWILPVVSKIEQRMAADPTLNHEYLPILGLNTFSEAAARLLLGDKSSVIAEKRLVSVQCLSGTGSLRVGADFCAKILNCTDFYYSLPTWENHHLVFVHAGFKNPRTYRYWDEKKRGLDMNGLLADLSAAKERSVIILHACAHNPTGCDPTQDQWKQIADVMEAKKLIPFFDSAYQGFASGDVDKDAWAVRYFVSRGFEILCAQSFAKNFGLYNERVGNLVLVTKDAGNVAEIKSQLTLIIRGMYSNPPNHGARIVSTALNDPELNGEWKKCIQTMSTRILRMREELHAALKRLGTPGNWDHIISQIGMFSFTGLTKAQCDNMIEKHHCYLISNGRINMCGLNSSNLEHVAQAIHDSVVNIPAGNH